MGSDLAPVADIQLQYLIALPPPARSVPPGIAAQDGGDAEDIPDSFAPVPFRSDLCHLVRRKRGKGMCHPDGMRAWCQGDLVCLCQPLIDSLGGGD